MDLLTRLDSLMAANGERPLDLAKNAGIPPTTIYGLYQKGYKNARISTLMKICNYYGVTLDYLVKGSSGISNNAMIIAVKYDRLDKHGRELLEFVLNHEVERAKQTNGYDISSTKQGLGEPVQNQEIHQCHTRRTNQK